MTDYNTIEKLTPMHMSAMANAFCLQMNDSKMKDVPFEDRFGMIVDVEYTSRKNNRLKRLIKNASFEQVNASIDSYKIDIESIDPSRDESMRKRYGLDPSEVK